MTRSSDTSSARAPLGSLNAVHRCADRTTRCGGDGREIRGRRDLGAFSAFRWPEGFRPRRAQTLPALGMGAPAPQTTERWVDRRATPRAVQSTYGRAVTRATGAMHRWRVAAGVACAICFGTGCVRFQSDAPPMEAGATDAIASSPAEAGDSGEIADAAADADVDGAPSDAMAPLPPLCKGRDPSIADTVAEDTIADLLKDCRIGAYFNSLPGIRLDHFVQCFGAQLGSVLGCVRADGTKVKYPAFDSYRELCRDMKTAHAALTASDGDYDAFMSVFTGALAKNGFSAPEVTRIAKAYGSTKGDIVHLKDAGPTRACEAGVAAAP